MAFATTIATLFLAQADPAFDLASVRVAPKTALNYPAGFAIRGGRYEFRHATMVDLISKAYGIPPDKVIGGPSWLELDKFDVIARFPEGTDPATLKLMLRSLLTDRFGLAARQDTRPLPAWLLTAEKTTLLKPSDKSGDAAQCRDETAESQPGEPQVPLVSLNCHQMTMAAFAEQLGDLRGSWYYVGDNPILDRTGQTGAWDFRLQYHQRERVADAGSHVVTLFDGLSKLGLKLEAGESPMPVIVVDSVNERPTENSPEIENVFPEGPLKFDLADLKPADPDTKSSQLQNQPGGRINIRGWRLLGLVEEAWNFPSDDRVVGAPKFTETDRWDLIAKAPAEMAGAGAGDSVDQETLDGMLKALLAERFQLAAHIEERPLPVWTLSAVKPTMKKANPSERTKCIEGAATLADARSNTDTRNGNPVLGRMLTCRNVSMKYLAEQLQYRASGYIHSEVLDETGLEGGWDFTLSFSKVSQLNGGSGGADQPNGALSVQDAIAKQLGLKLQLKKRPVPVLVIDRIERKPTDN